MAQPKKVFVISPIGKAGSDTRKSADRFLKYIVRAALPEPEYAVTRADEHDSPYAITEAMLKDILEADLCVADISGRNPNVMYELALAHAADKKVIILQSDEESLPFDIKDMRAISYGMMPDEIEEAVKHLQKKARHEPESKAFKDMLNPVATAFRQWMDVQRLESETGTPEQAFGRVLEGIDRKLDIVARGTRQISPRSAGPTAGVTYFYDEDNDPIMRGARILRRLQDIPSRVASRTIEAIRDEGENVLQAASSDYPGNRHALDLWTARATAILADWIALRDGDGDDVSGSFSLQRHGRNDQ